MADTLCGGAVSGRVLYRTGVRYSDRNGKAGYIADKYAAILRGSVLDVGCDTARLRGLVAEPSMYVGVDLTREGGADLAIDLDCHSLPFADRSFDTVLCTDVLEHLDRAHAVFDELCRVAGAHVIVSLPNPLRTMLETLVLGQTSIKYYGMPAERPPDRHRWFMNAVEAATFVRTRGAAAGFEIEQLDYEAGAPRCWSLPDGRNVFDLAEVKPGTMWCVLGRRDSVRGG